MGYVSKYKGIDLDQAIEFAKNNADINEKLSGKAEALHTHKLSDITGLTDLKISWENIIGKPEKFPCDGSCDGSNNPGNGDGGGGSVSGTVAWGNITGKPATFAPTAHTHVITDLSNLTDLTVDWNNIVNKPENIGSGSGITSISWDKITDKPNTFTPSSHQHNWDSIESKPTRFTPAAHRHDISEIDGYVPGTGGGVVSGSVSWDDILEKPDLAARVHKHSISDVIGLEDRLTNIELSGGGSGTGNTAALENKLNIIENDVDNLQSQVEIVQTGFSIVQSTVVANQGTINNIQTTTTNLKDDVDDVKTDVEGLKTSIKTLEQSVGQNNNVGNEVSTLKQNVLTLAQKDVELENAIAGVGNEIDALDTKITQTAGTIDTINKSVTDAYKAIEEMQETVDQFTGSFEDQLDSALAGSEFGVRLDNIENSVENNTHNIEELSTTVEEVQENVVELTTSVESISETLSEHYYIWQGEDDTVPTLTNEPAIQWISVSDKKEHVGDFYINSLGYCYKFIDKGNTYAWEEVHDRYIVPYAKQIERKSTIFISQPGIDDSYKPGDLWINAVFRNEDETLLYSSETLVCIEEKEEGSDFSINHWDSCNFASTQDINGLKTEMTNYQRRVILQDRIDLFKEETWIDSSGTSWIYNGLVISVINEHKLYLLIDKDNYQVEDSWIEIGKTLSLTWDNITDKPDFLEIVEGEVESVKNEIENISSIVEMTQTSLNERIDSIENESLVDINETLSTFEELLENHYYIWQGEDDTVPELTNDPAVQWISDSNKKEHIGDFYINSLGYCYKFVYENNKYSWKEVQDRYIVPYARQIERKSTIFINRPGVNDSYKPGDLWINAVYFEEGSSIPTFNEDVLVCIEEKIEGEPFDIKHWELSNITNPKELNDLRDTIENYRTRIIIKDKLDLFKEETWKSSETGEIWIYNGLVISVINEHKLYLLIDKDNYQVEDSWIEIGKTLSLTWDNITDKPDFLDTINDKVNDLESTLSLFDTNLNDNVLEINNRLELIENNNIPEIESSIEDIQETLSEHYYIWQGEDDTVPELTNDPAVQWISDSNKKEHIGDFYINSLGYCYKFVYENNKYSWKEVQDRYIVPYAKRIGGKSTIFISQPGIDDYYTIGDIWLNASYTEKDVVLYDRETLVCTQEKIEGSEFNIEDWERASIVDKEFQNIDNKIENYRTRIILEDLLDLYKEETWKLPDGSLWIYNGLVISVINEHKLYLLVDKDNYQVAESWIEIGKTLSLTWDNITDKPNLAAYEHIHENYENSLNNLDESVSILKDEMVIVQESLSEYDLETFPQIEEDLTDIKNSLIGQFYIWHGLDNEAPNKLIYPESEWLTSEEKRAHVGDFYITQEGVCYKYTNTSTGFEWILVSDRYITSYARKIDTKSTIFSTTPTDDDSYKPGDIWINATYRDDFDNLVLNNDIAVCVSGKDVGDAFNLADWQAVLKADDVNIDNTALTIGANQTILGHKTFVVPIYFGADGTGPTSEGDAYRPLYSSIYEQDNNFFFEAGKRASTGEIITLNIKNTTAGPIRITSELTKDYKNESARSGNIEIESKYGGDISITSSNDAGVRAGKVNIVTKGAKKENSRDDILGLYIDPSTNSASIYSQDTQITNLCDGYAEVSGYKGFAITSKADSSRNDMTGVRFKWEKEDQDGNILNTLDIHRVSYKEGEVIPESLSIKVNGSAEVLTSANFKTYVESEGNIIDFNTGYITQPGQTDGSEDVSDLLQSAINDAISNNAKLIIKYGTYLLKKRILIRGLNRDFSSLTIDANNALFLCDQDLINNKSNYGGTLPDGGTQRDDLTLDDVKSSGALFTVGTNPISSEEDDYDQGTLEFLNARIKVLNSNIKRTTLIAFDIQSQKCIRFEKISIEDFHTGFKLERCTKNPSIRKTRIVNTVFGIHSLGKVGNLTVEDVDFIKNGTAVYIDRESTGDFSCCTLSHCLFDNCNQGIYGHSKYVISALRIKSCKFNSNESFDILLKNRIIYPTIENVTFTDTTRKVIVKNEDGSTSEVEEVVPWQERSTIPISIPEGYIISSDIAINRELSNVVPAESSIGGTHTATWTKTPLNWGDNNIIITDNIFYDCHLVQVGNDKKGSHVSGVQFSGNRIEGSIENCIKICSELDGNCSGVSVFNNSYQSTKRETSGQVIAINFEVPIKSDLSAGMDYMPAGGFVSRYSMGPVVPKTNKTEEGQIGDIRWDETKAYLKTETGWKAIQFTHAFDNEGIANAWKPLETASQEPVDIEGYKVGDIVWNVDGSSRTLGWRFVKKAITEAASWEAIEDLIRIKLNG